MENNKEIELFLACRRFEAALRRNELCYSEAILASDRRRAAYYQAQLRWQSAIDCQRRK